MAHNLTFTNGKYEFAYAGEAPWHGLGQRLPAVATKDDIIRAAGLEWIDRVRTSKVDGTLRANAAEAAVLGIGQDLRNRAMASALALVN